MSNVPPSKLDVFILAESIRQEAGGRISILGAYAAGQILIGPTEPLPLHLPIALYGLFKDGEGTFSSRVRLLDPSGAELGNFDLQPTTKIAGQALTLMINFQIFSFPGLGKYSVQIFLDGKQYNDEFSLARAPAPIT